MNAAKTIPTVGAGTVEQSPRFTEEVTVRGLAQAGTGDYVLSFSGPVALPGVSLPAGTYIFSRPTANVLHVLSANRRMIHAMMTTIPTERARATDEAIVLGGPLAAGAPRRIVAWFPPGSTTGQELIYEC